MTTKTNDIKVLPDDTIEVLAARMVDSYRPGLEAHAEFEGVELVVKGGDTVGDVLQMYERAKAA